MELTRPLLYDDTGDVFEREPYSILVSSLLIGTVKPPNSGHHLASENIAGCLINSAFSGNFCTQAFKIGSKL